ncbi:MAG: hypothetical protein H6817_07460 [Phycisphaerales bacterium]|nr:hypothetical protein [Phycisphaerales bacterium]
MRNPRRWRNISLAFFVSGAIALLGVFLASNTIANLTTQRFLVLYGATAAFFGAISAFMRHLDLRAMQALARGEGILARWCVDPASWRAFVAQGNQFGGQRNDIPNEYSALTHAPDAGIEIIVGREAIQIEESIHTLPRRGTPEVTYVELVTGQGGPDCIELGLYYPPGGHGASGVPRSAKRTMLRFPVTPDARGEAEAVVAYYESGRPGEADWFHGRGDGTDAEDLSECMSCGYKTHALRSHCPKCGCSLQSRRWSRRFGFALTLCGLVVSGTMGYILYRVAPMLLNPGQSTNGTTFSGTATQGKLFLGIMGLVLAFGLIVLFYGLWQISTGRRHPRIIAFVVFIFAILCVLAMWS